MKRREFLIASGVVSGGIVIGSYAFSSNEKKELNPLISSLEKGESALTPYIRMDRNGVTIISPRAEMGQGIQGTLAALVAEELEYPLSKVKVEHGPPSFVYANRVMYPLPSQNKSGIRAWISNLRGREIYPFPHTTGAQSSIKDAFVKMRKAGAAARIVLIKAASKKWQCDEIELTAKEGFIHHSDGRKLHYLDLVEALEGIDPPVDPELKKKADWTQLGQSKPRMDMFAKCTGTAQYAIDIHLPEMVFATALLNPHIGGGLEKYNTEGASKLAGFLGVVEWRDGLVVLGTNTWYAFQAAKSIEVEWGQPPYPQDQYEHRQALEQALRNEKPQILKDEGNSENISSTSIRIDGEYFQPYQAHATMEPMTAVAWLKENELKVWAGTQNPMYVRHLGATIAGLPIENIEVHTTLMGGSFGRRTESQFIELAIKAAVKMKGKPVKVSWSRETDFAYDKYNPLAFGKFQAQIDQGELKSLDLDFSSLSLIVSYARREYPHLNKSQQEQIDVSNATGAVEQPYNIDSYRVRAFPAKQLLPVGWLRGVAETHTVFFTESAIDESAIAAKKDPLHFRLGLLQDPIARDVLNKIRLLSNWDKPLQGGRARGVAFAISSGAATAQVIELVKESDGIRIDKVFICVDVGYVLDPQNAEAQVSGSAIYGICAAMQGEITVSKGKVKQSNFHDYPLIRMSQVPEVFVELHESKAAIFGVGESGTATAAPALGNALYALTGQRFRELPYNKAVNFVNK